MSMRCRRGVLYEHCHSHTLFYAPVLCIFLWNRTKAANRRATIFLAKSDLIENSSLSCRLSECDRGDRKATVTVHISSAITRLPWRIMCIFVSEVNMHGSHCQSQRERETYISEKERSTNRNIEITVIVFCVATKFDSIDCSARTAAASAAAKKIMKRRERYA